MFFYHLAGGPTWEVITEDTDLRDFQLLKTLIGRDVFWANVGWDCDKLNLPLGHKNYLVMVEGPELAWIEREAERLGRPIDVLGMVNDYGYSHPLVRYHPWIEWHYQTRRMIQAFPWAGKSDSCNIISALSARPTQSKIWVLVKLLRLFPQDQILVSLGANIEPKNVHGWKHTGCAELDDLTDEFVDKYLDKVSFSVDEFDAVKQDIKNNHNYNARPYRDVIFNINNESWHYSLHQVNERKFTWPGPFLTEKTMKCLLSETALINNGQFDTYRTLEDLGFKFDYNMDLGYDRLPENLDRARGLMTLLDNLSQMTVDQCAEATIDSRIHNRQHIVSGDFYDICEKKNLQTIAHLLENML